MKANCKNCGNEFEYSPHQNRGKYCSLACTKAKRAKDAEALREQRYQSWLAGNDLTVKNPRALIREFVIRRDGYKCSCCGINTWNDKEITLWTDHIDGNATNNHPSNFRLICPNCDSQSATFGAKNYGKGRKSRGLPQYG